MNFANASLLAGLLPLLALPIVIHFLNKRFPRRFFFSSVELLRKTSAERSRIYQWRHRLLTLVRTAFLLLLLLAFLKPVIDRFGTATRAAGGRRVLLVVDNSLSMEYRGSGTTARERAVIEASKILDALGTDDECNIIRVDRAATACFTGFSRDSAEARRFLKAIRAGAGGADFTQANITAAQLLGDPNGAADSQTRTEIYYLSDFQRKNWGRVDFQPIEKRARLFFVDLADPSATNRALLAAEIPASRIVAGDSVPLEISVGNYGPLPLRETLTVRVDDRIELQQVVEASPWSSTRVTVPVPAGSPGSHVCEVRLPPDRLTADDRWSLVLPVLEKEEIATSSSETDTRKDPIRYLHTALNPFPDQAGSLMPRHVPTSGLDSAALAAANKLFITRSGPLDDAKALVLAHFLHHGGNIVWFLDGEFDPENLERLEKAAGGRIVPLRLAAVHRAERVGLGAQHIATGDFRSRLLRLFRGPLRQDLGLLEFYDFRIASTTDTGKVLLRFADETPAMCVSDHGLGNLVLMNFSVSEFSSNLARQRLFPAWIQDLVKQLDASQPTPLAFATGQIIEAEVWKEDLRRQPVVGPRGQPIEVREEPMGERSLIRFTAHELGFYSLPGSRSAHRWAVNADPEEADLRAVDRSQLPATEPENPAPAFLSGAADYEHVAQGQPLMHWFVLAGLAVLVLEMALQLAFRRLAP